MNLRKWIVLGILLLSCNLCYSQSNSHQVAMEELVQQLFQQQEIAMNYEDFYEAMFQFYANPIDLNRATREELQALNILSPLQVTSFIEHRKKVGELVSKYELQTVPYFDQAIILKLLPFVKIINQKGVWKNIIDPSNSEASTYFILRTSQTLQPSRGYLENKFAGSPQQVYARFRSSKSKNYSIGFTMEKDAGEQLWWGDSMRNKGPDFLSFHVAIFNKFKIKSLVIGDYQLQFGQGLVLGAGFNFGKGAETITTVKRNNVGARPYTSVLEMAYFRGACITYALTKTIDFTAFYSGKKIDGNLQQSTDNLNFEDYGITSLINTGLHRTSTEIENKNVVSEKSAGANISFLNLQKNLHVGYTALGNFYSRSIEKDLYGYNRYEFTGNRNLVHSVDASWYVRNFNFFGEAAMSSSAGKAGTVGMLASLSSTVDISMVYRHFEKNFHSLYARAFAESYRPMNEQGLYWGIKIKPSKPWTIAAYYDYFKFPWLKYRTDAPSAGNESLLRITWQPSKILTVYVQTRWLNKQRNYTDVARPLYFPENYQRQNYLFDLSYKASDVITLHTRFQTSSFKQIVAATHGFYMMQEITFRARLIRISARYALFDSDDYDNRQYVYEKDVLYAFSIPMLYGRGSRYYLLAHCRINKHLDCWIKYAHTQYRNVTANGSGWDMIMGNAQSDVRFQLRWKL